MALLDIDATRSTERTHNDHGRCGTDHRSPAASTDVALLAECRAANAALTATLDRARTIVSRAEPGGRVHLWWLDVDALCAVLGIEVPS